MTARVVGHHQTICCERPSDVAPHAPAIQTDVRASGARLLDQDQQQKSTRSHQELRPNKDELTKELLQYQEKSTEVDERRAEL